MKKRLFIQILIIITCISFLKAQNYQTVNSNTIATFLPSLKYGYLPCFNCSEHKYIQAIKIINSTSNGDTLILFPNNEIQVVNSQPLCFHDSDSWVGEKILILKNGENDIVFNHKDTLRIKTNATKNEKWKIYQYPDKSLLNGHVYSIDTMTISGAIDSVKTIILTHTDSVNTTDTIAVIKLSKTNGFVQLFDFRSLFNDNIPEIIFTYITNTNLALKYSDVFNFIIGDEFHYHQTTAFSGVITKETFSIKKIIDKALFQDSIKYKISQKYWGYTFNGQNNDYFSGQDTITETDTSLNNYVISDTFKIPSETIYLPNSGVTSYLTFKDSDLYNNRIVIIRADPGSFTKIGNYYCGGSDSYEGNYYYYIIGCAKLDYSFSTDGGHTDYFNLDLVYYKKNGEEWGTPLNPLDIKLKKLEEDNPVIFPNPTCGSFKIQNKNSISSIEIIDIMGNTSTIKSNNNLFDISCFPKGIYLINIKPLNRKLKIIKQ